MDSGNSFATNWRTAKGVWFCAIGDCGVLLSIKQQAYYNLNETGAKVWHAIQSRIAVTLIASELATTYAVTVSEVEDDIRIFLSDLHQRGFIVPTLATKEEPTTSEGTPPIVESRRQVGRLPSVPRCVLMLASVAVCASCVGHVRILDHLRRRSKAPICLPLSHAASDELTRRLRRAAAILPVRTFCLTQSIAVCLLLQRMGLAPTIRIGVHPFPFVAHAWVECDGHPVNETREQLMNYRAFSSLAF